MSASAREVIRKLLAEHHTSAAERALREDQEGADRILAALSAAGFVIVPREPTSQMKQSANDEGFPPYDTWRCYRAMLSAAEGKQ